MTKSQIPVGEYLFRRIASLGIRHIFGVPGDFNRMKSGSSKLHVPRTNSIPQLRFLIIYMLCPY